MKLLIKLTAHILFWKSEDTVYLVPNIRTIKERLTLWLCFVYMVGVDIFQESLQINTWVTTVKTELESYSLWALVLGIFLFAVLLQEFLRRFLKKLLLSLRGSEHTFSKQFLGPKSCPDSLKPEHSAPIAQRFAAILKPGLNISSKGTYLALSYSLENMPHLQHSGNRELDLIHLQQ